MKRASAIASTAATLALFALSGCQCKLNNDDLTQITDSGVPLDDAGPPPPVFPLKAGDQLKYTGLGGRTVTCDGAAAGGCQRAINATYIVQDPVFRDNRWTIIADVVYEGTDDTIEAAAIAPLILENGAPFAQVTEGTPQSAEGAEFTTDTPATPDLTENGFPFFQAESGAAEVFETAGATFCQTYVDADELANCEFQIGARKMEVYFKDEQAGGAAKLHKVSAEYSQFGFVCGWDEGVIPFVDDDTTPRDQSSFGNNPAEVDLVAQFPSPPKVTRDGVEYTCSCFSQECRNQASNTCLQLDPSDDPVTCP